MKVQPWHFNTGEIGDTVVILQDMTKLKASEQSLQRLNDELNHFNYRVSHDQVAPLQTIKGFLQLCQMEIEVGNTEEVKLYHEKIEQRVDILSQLIRDLTNLARADQKEADKEAIPMEAFIRHAFELQMEALGQPQVELCVWCEVESLWVEMVRLQQVLDNLLSNALKYRKENSEASRIEVEVVQMRDEVTIWLKDNGMGFEDAFAHQAFDMFSRGDSKQPGSGLGLYLVHRHIEKMHGTIELISPRDETCFKMGLPNLPSSS